MKNENVVVFSCYCTEVYDSDERRCLIEPLEGCKSENRKICGRQLLPRNVYLRLYRQLPSIGKIRTCHYLEIKEDSADGSAYIEAIKEEALGKLGYF